MPPRQSVAAALLVIERDKHRVSATCDDRNPRSAAVLDRVGMRREGHLLESTWSEGEQALMVSAFGTAVRVG